MQGGQGVQKACWRAGLAAEVTTSDFEGTGRVDCTQGFPHPPDLGSDSAPFGSSGEEVRQEGWENSGHIHGNNEDRPVIGMRHGCDNSGEGPKVSLFVQEKSRRRRGWRSAQCDG